MNLDRFYLVGCGGQKAAKAAPARSLYTGTLFRMASTYAEQTGRPWRILSGLHGIVRPEQVLEPYDQRVPKIAHEWLELVRTVRQQVVGLGWRGVVELHMGAEYAEVALQAIGTARGPLIPGLAAEDPLARHQVGQRLAWYKAQGVVLVKPPALLDCPYCGQRAAFRPTSEHIFGRDFGPVYECTPCAARVGCHKGTNKPLGTLATARVRKMREAAHKAFDPAWRVKMERDGCTQTEARRAAYAWLAAHMGVEPGQCHIGWMQADELYRVIELCSRRPLPPPPPSATP